MGRFLSLDLFSLLGSGVLLLGKQLFHVGLWRCDFTFSVANVWASRESLGSADVRSVREPSLCDSHPSYQPRDTTASQVTSGLPIWLQFLPGESAAQQDQKIMIHCRCGDEVENSLRRPKSGRAEGKTSTALRTYMSVLILLAAVVAYVICIALTLEITSALTHVWLGLRKI
jgi:hypothetical protein